MTTPSDNPTRYKFVVNSAEEAVNVLRERLGENAKVISVRQVEGAGLARFLRAPKLEIIAEKGMPSPAPSVERERLPEHALETQSSVPRVAEPRPAAIPVPEPPPTAAVSPDLQPDKTLPVETHIVMRETEVAASLERERTFAPPDDLSRILQRGGLSDALLAQLRGREEWPALTGLPLREALTEAGVLLHEDYLRRRKRATGSRIAFIGSPGAGKTTALCKRLAMEVFFKQRQAVVLKVDMEKANPADGLAVFCDVLGVPMVRSSGDIPKLAENEALYIDFPGINPENQAEVADLSNLLTTVSADTRVLVVNAAYEASLIKKAYRMGAALAATHVVFTHLDELTQWGKLWEFVLSTQLTPLFLSCGQNIAGDFDEAVFEAVLERSFPAVT